MRKGLLKGLFTLALVLLGYSMNYADTKASVISAVASTVNGANTAALSCDGSTGSRWESVSSDPQWIYWDLGSSQSLSRIIIDWEAAAAAVYTIQGSTDAVTWIALATASNQTYMVNHVQITNNLSGNYRYVRMYGNTRTTPFGYSIWEASIYVNTTSSSTAPAVSSSSSILSSAVSSSVSSSVSLTASSVFTSSTASAGLAAIVAAVASTVNNNNTAALSCDGNVTGSRWESASSDPQWIYWDLGSSQSLSRIIIDWEAAAAATYSIQGSTDASTWTILATASNQTYMVNHVQITNNLSGNYRYVRMYGNTRNTSFGYSIWEVYIYTGTSSVSSAAVSSSSSAVSSPAGSSISSVVVSSAASSLSSIGVTKAVITAAAASGYVNGNVAAQSYDNNTGTRWEAAQSDPQWIYWDLGSAKVLNSIMIDWEVASASNYTIQGSSDAATWTTLATVVNSKQTEHNQITTALSGTYRYVRMYGTTRTSVYGYSIWEVSIFTGISASSASSLVSSSTAPIVSSAGGISSSAVSSAVSSSTASIGITLAPIAAAVASGYVNGNIAVQSCDNNIGSRWESPSTDPQWIYWDLGSGKILNKIMIDWETASAKDYTIQGSADANTWTTLAAVANTQSVNHLQITTSLSGTYRYVRMYGTTRTSIYGYSIWEVSIYTGIAGSSSSAGTSSAISSIAASSSSSVISSAAVSSVSSSIGLLTKSPKRGLAYQVPSTDDLSALSPGVSWWYNWSFTPFASLPSNYYQTYGMEFVPMLWGVIYDADVITVDNFILAHPEVKYILVMNEPNLADQAHRTPVQAANDWLMYEKVVSDMAAQGRTIKIVGPQMTWGNIPGYEDPTVWMDQFIAAYQASNSGRSPQIDYLGYHWYDYGISGQLDRMVKYGKQFWVSEFANWHSTLDGAQIDTLAKEEAQQKDMVNTCESRGDVFRYAWFTGRMTADDPYFCSLFTSTPGQLNDLGKQYISLPYAGMAVTNTNGGAIFGNNVFVFDTTMPMSAIQSQIDAVYASQQPSQFGPNRYAFFFKPGTYNINIPLGFYTSVHGLGQSPNDVTINGSCYCVAYLPNWNATCNFWRSVENLSVITIPGTPSATNMKWAVSQACPARRLHVKGSIDLHDNFGWASGGFFADTLIDNTVYTYSQQQWISRNSQWGSWRNGVWNMVFVGCNNPPAGNWDNNRYTTINQTPVIREKPYLYVDANGNYNVFVPALTKNSQGPTWLNGATPGGSIPMNQFYVAQAGIDTAATINNALSQGKNLILTPGVYYLNDTIRVTRANTVVLGIGYATLLPNNGVVAMSVADVDGVTLAGILFDAGPANSPVLLEVGPAGSSADHSANPTLLADLFFRVGGATIGNASVCMKINCNNVIGDNFWIWRADHGDNNSAGWNINPSENGLIVNGNNVTIYGLFCEHFEKYCTIWNGNGGQLYFYQSELAYDVPNQAAWMDGTVKGYASYKVADTVTSHNAYGLGIYSIFLTNNITCDSPIECPILTGVNFSNMITCHLALGSPSMGHIINTTGAPAGGTNADGTINSWQAAWGAYPQNK